MPEYTAEQLANVRLVRRRGRRAGATAKEIRSAVATILVETNAEDKKYRAPGSGDRDSIGAFQQRPSQGWGPGSEGLATDADQYYAAARKLRGKGLNAGQIAQGVQRSAFPDRYGQRLPEARALLRQVGGAGGAATLRGGIGRVERGSAPRLVPGSTTVDKRGALLAALTSGKGGSLLKRWQGEIASGDFTTTTPTKVVPGQGDKYRAGGVVEATVPGDRARPGTIHELFWNGEHAVNIKEGKREPKGFVEGHTDHVHLAADRETMERAAKLARSMGLHVGEYGKGITAGHATNSFHYKPYGAMDVSGKGMAEFARRIASGRF